MNGFPQLHHSTPERLRPEHFSHTMALRGLFSEVPPATGPGVALFGTSRRPRLARRRAFSSFEIVLELAWRRCTPARSLAGCRCEGR
jgi:hypothetical protein